MQLQRLPHPLHYIFDELNNILVLFHTESPQLNQISQTDQTWLDIPVIESFICFFTTLWDVGHQPVCIVSQILFFDKVFLFDTAKNIIDCCLWPPFRVHLLHLIFKCSFSSILPMPGPWKKWIFKLIFGSNSKNRKNFLHLLQKSWPLVEIRMSKDANKSSLNFRIYVFLDVTKKNINRKYLLNLLRTDIISIERQISKKHKLSSKNWTFPWIRQTPCGRDGRN